MLKHLINFSCDKKCSLEKHLLIVFVVKVASVQYKHLIVFVLEVFNTNSGKPRRGLGGAYLIFVIFFTRAKFLENKIYTEKRQLFALNL